jgi:hypothetical protein
MFLKIKYVYVARCLADLVRIEEARIECLAVLLRDPGHAPAAQLLSTL